MGAGMAVALCAKKGIYLSVTCACIMEVDNSNVLVATA